MRNLFLLGLFATMIVRAGAADRVTIEQLEQKLAANNAAHSSDGDLISQLGGEPSLLSSSGQDPVLAHQLDGLELSERLTAATLERIITKYQPGFETERSLELLADRSSFLDPPANEQPPRPNPDADAQQRMIESARSYVLHTLLRLPNFFATRTTAQLEDDAQTMKHSGLQAPTGLRLEGTSSGEITFRDGVEYVVPSQGNDFAKTRSQIGLESWGEFGTELATVLIDTAKSTFTFHHWEQTAAGTVAMYHYSVSKSDSHYEVNYSCAANKPFHDNPSYHGSLLVDPASGAILRVTLEADWKNGDPISHIASVIEYGPVTVGDRRYILPLRSLTFMMEEANACAHHGRNQRLAKPVTMLNRTTLSHYHRLGSSSTIISARKVEPNSDSGAADPDPTAPSASKPEPQGSSPSSPPKEPEM
jgi:hypothetical protein